MGGDPVGQREYLKRTISLCLPMIKADAIFKSLQQLIYENPKYICISVEDLYTFLEGKPTWNPEWLLEKLEEHCTRLVTEKSPDFLHAMDDLMLLFEEK